MALSPAELDSLEQVNKVEAFCNTPGFSGNGKVDTVDDFYTKQGYGFTHAVDDAIHAEDRTGRFKDAEKRKSPEEKGNKITCTRHFMEVMSGNTPLNLNVISVDLGKYGKINLSSYGSSPEESAEVKQRMEEMAQDPEKGKALSENLNAALKDEHGNNFDTYESQYNWEADPKNSLVCSMPQDASTAMDAVNDPHSMEADNFAMIKGETTAKIDVIAPGT